MIDIKKILRKLKGFSAKITLIDEFKPNQLVYVYIDIPTEKSFEWCLEITNNWIGISKLDKKNVIDFSPNSYLFYDEDSFFKFLQDESIVKEVSE